MEKNKKGLADAEDGEFILNESGTSVSTDQVEGVDIPVKKESDSDNKEDTEPNDAELEQLKE